MAEQSKLFSLFKPKQGLRAPKNKNAPLAQGTAARFDLIDRGD
ncbi:MAG TPA: hypothetical protein VIF39_02370 [Hyphomicrobium sp.]